MDDEVAQMKALCNTLRDHGYVTTGFDSPAAALAALRTEAFDLLITDLTMPEMDGITLLRSALEIDNSLVCIMMTGDGTIDTAVEAMRAGALDYILKPFKLSGVLPVLSRALAVRRLRAENVELARRVRERTEELEAANRELDAFAHSIAHDLRAPLRSVDGFSNILLEDHPELAPEVRHLLERVASGAKHMDGLINGLLRFSRMGRQPLVRQTVRVADLVQQVLAELRIEPQDQEVEVVVRDLPDVVGDGALLKQVFVNLLSNAFKFTRTRQPAKVEVGCALQDGEAVFYVRDNGAGFDPQYSQRLFGVFQRLHRAEEFEGTGVGLSIVQRIIHRHGGRIWAEAAVDKGATFHFTLPNRPDQ